MEKTYYELVQNEKEIGEALSLLRQEMEIAEFVNEDEGLLKKQKGEYRSLLDNLLKVGAKLDDIEKKIRKGK